MSENNGTPKTQQTQTPPKPSIDIPKRQSSYSGHKAHYPNPAESSIPDPTTLRDQWRFAIRQYSKWYSHAWGTAILAGGAFFALGWFIKGGNPLPSTSKKDRTEVSGSTQK